MIARAENKSRLPLACICYAAQCLRNRLGNESFRGQFKLVQNPGDALVPNSGSVRLKAC